MISHTTKKFREMFDRLPPAAQKQAKDAYRVFEKNPHHANLNFKHFLTNRDLWSVRIGYGGAGYRAIGKKVKSGEILWFWIGSHKEYEKFMKNMKKERK